MSSISSSPREDEYNGRHLISGFPLVVAPYIEDGVGTSPDRVLIFIAVAPLGANQSAVEKCTINNDDERGPNFTVIYNYPLEFQNAESLLAAEIADGLNLFNPMVMGLKNELARIRKLPLHSGGLKGRIFMVLPFKASKATHDIVVKVHPSNESIYSITLKKLDETKDTDITSLLKKPPAS